MHPDWIQALIGGGLIGVAVSLMLLFKGRVTGISGIINGLLSPVAGDVSWRFLFVLGLFLGGIALGSVKKEIFSGGLSTDLWTTAVAGILVGFGTILGSGCTSGHGVCGISRLSPRSIIATLVFIGAGVVSVALLRIWGVFP